MTGRGEAAEAAAAARWLRRRASAPAWGAALLMLALSVGEALAGGRAGTDDLIVVRAARAFLDGRSPYEDERFLYLPAAVPAALPQVLFSEAALHRAVPVATALLVLAGWWLSLRIFRVAPACRLSAAVVAGLALFLPFRSIVYLGNWTALCVVALPAALVLIRDGRWCAAAGVIGAATALKPMLVPVLLLFVLARRWRALAVACGVPAAAALAAAAAMPQPGLFFTRTLPFLLPGQDAYARPYDASPAAVLPRLGVPPAVAALTALALAAAGAALARRRWRSAGDPGLRLVDTVSLLMSAAFLVSRPSFLHYVLVVLLPLMASLPVRGSAPRSVWFWIPLLPQIAGVRWPELETAQRHAFKDAVMIVGLAALLAHRAVRAGPPRRDAVPAREEGAARLT